jgi:hypothetical protein
MYWSSNATLNRIQLKDAGMFKMDQLGKKNPKGIFGPYIFV